MNVFLNSVLHRINKNIKVIKIFSKKIKREERKYATTISYLNVPEIL